MSDDEDEPRRGARRGRGQGDQRRGGARGGASRDSRGGRPNRGAATSRGDGPPRGGSRGGPPRARRDDRGTDAPRSSRRGDPPRRDAPRRQSDDRFGGERRSDRDRDDRPRARRNDREDRFGGGRRSDRDRNRDGRPAAQRSDGDRDRDDRPGARRNDRDRDRRAGGRYGDRDRDRTQGRGASRSSDTRSGSSRGSRDARGGRERFSRDDRRGGSNRGGGGRRDRDDRGTKTTRAGDRRRPGDPSLPLRGRIVEYPSPRYRAAGRDEVEEETPKRKPSLRAVRGSDRKPSAQPTKAKKGRGQAKAAPPTSRRRRPRRTEAGDELARLARRDAPRAQAALERAATAYNEGRERDAARDLRALRDAYPDASGVRELLGLADYRLGHFNAAAKELEAFVELTGSVEQHPVLMDCYRAQRKYREIDSLWRELAETSPSGELVIEGRIVAAGALADQGRVSDAIALLERKADDTKRPQPHHLRLWYALGDLYERAGELPRARDLFQRIRQRQPDFVDVAERLAALH